MVSWWLWIVWCKVILCVYLPLDELFGPACLCQRGKRCLKKKRGLCKGRTFTSMLHWGPSVCNSVWYICLCNHNIWRNKLCVMGDRLVRPQVITRVRWTLGLAMLDFVARQAADAGCVAASAEGRQPPGAHLHSDDQDAGRSGGLPQPPWSPLPPSGWHHPSGAKTGQWEKTAGSWADLVRILRLHLFGGWGGGVHELDWDMHQNNVFLCWARIIVFPGGGGGGGLEPSYTYFLAR